MVKQFLKMKGEHRDVHTGRVTGNEETGDYEYRKGYGYRKIQR